jgi:hypothetical protein
VIPTLTKSCSDQQQVLSAYLSLMSFPKGSQEVMALVFGEQMNRFLLGNRVLLAGSCGSRDLI